MVLATSCRDCTSKFSNANEDREVPKPDQCKAIYETSWSTTVFVKYNRSCARLLVSYFWNPIANILFGISYKRVSWAMYSHKQTFPSAH
jgi:hypothetical protein